MATSGSANFNQTRNEIINDAFQLAGIYGVGRTISGEDMIFAHNLLNKMVKTWQAQGLHLWTKEEGVLFIADTTASYTLSSDSSSARVTLKSDEVTTQLNGAAASGATSLTVDTTTSMATSDNIGIVLDDDTIHWTTISTIPTSTTLTIATGLASAAADNNNVYTFTSRINKPMRILSARRLEGVGTNESSIALHKLSHEEYFDIPNKNNNGIPNSWYYNPDISTGTFYLWPRPNDPQYRIDFTFERSIEDFDASTDNADFPAEWLEVITYQLASRLCTPFGQSAKFQELVSIAGDLIENVRSFDNEVGSLFVSPESSR